MSEQNVGTSSVTPGMGSSVSVCAATRIMPLVCGDMVLANSKLIAESPAMVMLNPATVPLCFRIAYLPMVDDVPLHAKAISRK